VNVPGGASVEETLYPRLSRKRLTLASETFESTTTSNAPDTSSTAFFVIMTGFGQAMPRASIRCIMFTPLLKICTLTNNIMKRRFSATWRGRFHEERAML
jgi:hypothetical protein